MSIHLGLVNHDRRYESLTREALVINDIDTTKEADKISLKNQLYTEYNTRTGTDVMSNLPVCSCGAYMGYNRRGKTCPICRTEVKSVLDGKLEPILWVRSPNGVSKLINDHVYTMLSNSFTVSGFNLIQWLTDTRFVSKNKTPPQVDALLFEGVKRGYNNFVENFDEYIKILDRVVKAKKEKGKERRALMRLIREHRDCIFSYYSPLPNRALIVIEDTNVGRYASDVVQLVNAIQMFVSIDTGRIKTVTTDDNDSALTPEALSIRTKENRTARMIHHRAEFFEKYIKETMGSKRGLYRKHIYSTRGYFTARGVISSITEPHSNDELHIPWSAGVGMLRYHLVNKLKKRFPDMNVNEIITFLNAYSRRYHPVLDEIFRELIAESPEKGLVCSFCRNPSLGRGSIQRKRITKVTTDPDDPTIRMSILATGPFNADFDGDAMTIALAVDEKMARLLKGFSLYKNAFEIDSPRKVAGHITHPKPLITSENNWIMNCPVNTDQSLMDIYAV